MSYVRKFRPDFSTFCKWLRLHTCCSLGLISMSKKLLNLRLVPLRGLLWRIPNRNGGNISCCPALCAVRRKEEEGRGKGESVVVASGEIVPRQFKGRSNGTQSLPSSSSSFVALPRKGFGWSCCFRVQKGTWDKKRILAQNWKDKNLARIFQES